MEVSSGVSILSSLSMVLFIVYGLFILLGLYAMFLLIKFLIRAIQALDIHLDEKRNGRRF